MLIQSITFAGSNQFEQKTIIVAGDEYFPPYEYIDTNGVYKGFNIDVMHAIAIEMGLDIEIKPMKWKNVKVALENGEIDAIQGITNTYEREKQIAFTKPYLVTSQMIFIPIKNDYIKSLRDLQNKTVAVQEKDVANEMVDNIPGVKILKADSQLVALEQLIQGHADAYIGNRMTGLYSIQKFKYSEQVKMIGTPINPKDYGIGVKRGNDDLLKIMNDGLEIIKRNGTYDKIYDKWFGEEIVSTKDALRSYIYIFLTAVGVLSLIVFANMRMNLVLRNEVNKRTKEIEQQNVFKEHIMNSFSGGLITFDVQGMVLSINKNVSRICQFDAYQLLGKSFQDTFFSEFVDPNLFTKVLLNGEVHTNCEATVTISGHDRIMEYNVFPIKDTEDVTQGITITFNDITVRRQNNEQIKRRDKFESIGRLTANIAHEIRNPLTAIKTYIELIPKKMNNPAFQEQIVKDVPLVIERLNDLITELLEYARPREAQKTLFPLDRPINEVMSLIDGELNKNGIVLELDVLADCFVRMDSQQLKQILLNLLINSVEAVKKSQAPKIVIKTVRGEEGYYVEIIDNGIGIASEDLTVIFEPFFTKKSSGTGLGLSIAQQLAEENDGLLTVDSTINVGTIMRLYLPLPSVIDGE